MLAVLWWKPVLLFAYVMIGVTMMTIFYQSLALSGYSGCPTLEFWSDRLVQKATVPLSRPTVSIVLSPSFATGWVILAQAQERRLFDKVIHFLRHRIAVSHIKVRATPWFFTMLLGAVLLALGFFWLFSTL
jgi:hypothetical protein